MNNTRKAYNPKTYQWIFIGLLGLVSLLYSYDQIATLRPQSIHQWRQSDCLSITMNYYMEDRGFLDASVHHIGAGGNGKTISEFPIIYYAVAQLWKVFGYHEWIFRLVNTLILFAGLFALFKVSEDILQHSVWAMTTTFLLFSSPILVYYGNNFMADVPAFSMALIGWLFFWKFYKTQLNKWLGLAVFFFSVGVLLKASAIMSLGSIGLVFILDFFNLIHFKKEGKLFQQPWKQSLFFIVPLLIIFSWYAYASHYQNQNNPGLFLIGTLPIWELSASKVASIANSLWHDKLPQYFNWYALLTLFLLYTSLLVFIKKANKLFIVITTTMLLGFIIFVILFFQVFNLHDYYLINMLIFIPFVLITFLLFIKENHPTLFNGIAVKVVALLLTAFAIYHTSTIQTSKYFSVFSPLLKQEQVNYWKWHHWNYQNHVKALESITPYLRSIGIEREDRVYSTPDLSINISLYLMDQKGWTDFNRGEFAETEEGFMNYITQHQVKYLIVNDSTRIQEAYLQPYLSNKIGAYKNVSIYDIQTKP